MKSTYHDDLQEYRREFNTIDKKDPASIRQWFDKHPYLSINDNAQIADRSIAHIRSLKKIAGIKGKMCGTAANFPISKAQPKITNIPAPDDWTDPAWLKQMVRIYSLQDIANAANRSKSVVCRKLQKLGITDRRGSKPNNKYCTLEWCTEHYINQKLTQKQCGKLAGICQQTFVNWLNRFKIPVRNCRDFQKSHVNIQLWVRKLFYELQEHPTVRKVYLRSDHVHVRFMNYFWETYYVDHRPLKQANGRRKPFSYVISKEDAVINKVPQILPEFEKDLGNIANECHIAINRKDLRKASFMERRLAIHEYCRQFTQRGWMWPEYPDSVLQKEWNTLCDYKEIKYIIGSDFTIFSRNNTPALGRRIIEHFFDLSEFGEVFRSPRMTMRVLNRLLDRKDLAFNVHNLFRVFSCDQVSFPPKYPKFRITDPAAYATVLSRLGIRGSVLDLTPGFGNRAIACALKGLKYITIPDDRFKMALDKGFAEFIGLDYEEFDDQKVDLLLCDNNFTSTDISKAIEHTNYAKNMMIFVPHNEKLKTQAKYKPKSVIKVKTRWHQKVPDFFFIY